MNIIEKSRNIFWHFVSSIFPYIRDVLLSLHLIYHKDKRQRYFLGWLIPEKKLDELKEYLLSQGFSNHFIAWIDDEEYCGLRLRQGRYQYHIRLFKDGEVRGHYELTPEDHPVAHFKEVGLEERRGHFMHYLRGWVSDPPLRQEK